MPTIRQLKYLLALSEERHFRRAAERVNITQPTLSTQIQELERTLDATLIDRTAKNVVLTPLGELVVGRAQRILADVKDIVDLSAASQHGFHGTIRLGVPPTLGPYLLPHIVPTLHSKYPELKLYVKEGKLVDLQEKVQSGVYDLIISPLPINNSELVVEPLFREPLLIACASDHEFADKEHLKKADLVGKDVLAIEQGHHLHDKVRQICDDVGACLLRDYEGTSLDTLRLMVGMGVGIAFLPSLYVRSEIGDRGQLKVLELAGANLHRQIGMAWRKRSPHADGFNEIAGVIREIVKDCLPEVSVLGNS